MRLRALAPALALALLAPVGSARADAPSAASVNRARHEARALAKVGYENFRKGDYQAAVEAFQRAEERFHAPTIVLFLARAHTKLGRLREAGELYERLLEEDLPNYAPDEFRQAQASAREELAALEPKLSRLRLGIEGGDGRELRVALDGKPVDLERARTGLLVEPGSHELSVEVDGRPLSTRSFTVGQGEAAPVEISVPPSSAPSAAPRVNDRDRPSEPRAGSLAPAAVALGVGAAGLGVGAVTGLLALGTASDLEARCPDRLCEAADRAEADKAHTLAHVSTAAFVVGGLGLATGIVLLVTRRRSDRPTAAASLGLGSLSVRGAF